MFNLKEFLNAIHALTLINHMNIELQIKCFGKTLCIMYKQEWNIVSILRDLKFLKNEKEINNNKFRNRQHDYKSKKN